MSESSSTPNGGGDRIPPWMKTVSEESLYNAPPADDEEGTAADPSPSPPNSPSPERAPAAPNTKGHRESLQKKLSISMGFPSEIPEPNPDLQPEMVGHVRADLNRQLEKAVSVLNSRYVKGPSKSLLIEFALRRTLLDLQEQDEESALVQWLDSVLPQS